MATRKRVRKPVRAPKPACGRKARKPARKPRNPKPVRAIESRRIQMTPALYADVRRRYEQTAEGLNTMGADLGCSAETVRNIARREGWVRYVAPPRDLSPAAKLAAQVEAMAAARAANPTPIPSPQGGGEEIAAAPQTPFVPALGSSLRLARAQAPAGIQFLTAEQAALGSPLSRGRAENDTPPEAANDPPAVALTVDEMHRVVVTELATVKAMRARMREAPQTPADAEKTARTLHNLMTILREIRLQQAGAAAAAAAADTKDKDAHDDYDDPPADIDEFRHEFARRIRAFVASRTEGGGHAGGDAAPPADQGGA